MVSTGGIAVCIVTDEFAVFLVQTDEMGTHPIVLMPEIIEDANILPAGKGIEFRTVCADLYRKTPAEEERCRPPEGGARVAVDQRKLPLAGADQGFRIHGIAQDPQRIVDGDPAAAGGGTGAEAIAPLILWDIALVIDQIFHAMPISAIR